MTVGNWARPAVTVDLVLLTDEPAPRVLLIRRAREPERGKWALPGGFVEVGDGVVDQGEDLDAAARRELHEETGLAPALLAAHRVGLVQVGAFGKPYRDARMRVITIAFAAWVPVALIAHTLAGDDAAEARWWPLEKLDRSALAFDHALILAAGQRRLGDPTSR